MSSKVQIGYGPCRRRNGAARQTLRIVVVWPIDFCRPLMLDCTFDLVEEEEGVCAYTARRFFAIVEYHHCALLR